MATRPIEPIPGIAVDVAARRPPERTTDPLAEPDRNAWFPDLSRWYPATMIAFLVLGAALRLRMYLFDRSLWFDETLISLNILRRPLSGLVPPLEYHQGAPFGFLALEKAAVLTFGNSEYALRLVPLLAGIAALILLYRLGRRILPAPAALVAVGLFALSVQQIGYSTEVKPYSLDTAMALLVTLSAVRAADAASRRNLLVLAVTGAVAVWFSYPAAFVVAGAGICLGVAALFRRQWTDVAGLALVGVVWALSFLAVYVGTMRGVASDTFVRDIWSTAFVPWQLSYWTAEWILDQNLGVFHDPVGITRGGLGAFTFIVGWFASDAPWQRRRWLLVAPLACAFAAAALHRYPYEGRFLNFAVPAILCVVGLGLARVATTTARSAPVVGLSLVALLFLDPARNVAFLAARPTGLEEIRPVLDYVHQHEVAGDALYLYWRTEPAFAYYSERWKRDGRLPAAKVIYTGVGGTRPVVTAGSIPGQTEMDAVEVMNMAQRTAMFQRDLDALRDQSRVWIVFYHVSKHEGLDEEEWLHGQLQHLGREEDYIKLPGASAYLYDLRAAPHQRTE